MGRRGKQRGKPIDGVLLLDKPGGMTSNKALQKCRYLIDARKGGHTGALDPLATGLLPLCFGQATKISSYLLANDKTYRVSITLGKITDTGDADGKVLETREVNVNEEAIRHVLASFVGEYDQVPPMYSALKVNGQPLYKLARQGIQIEREARRVTAYDIRFISFEGTKLAFEVDCTSGFYVRSLSEEIGEALECGAHVSTLRRTKIADLKVDDAISLAEFEALSSDEARVKKLLPADQLLAYFPKLTLDQKQSAALKYGQMVDVSVEKSLTDAQCIRLYGADEIFMGLGQINQDGQLVSKRLFIQS